MIKFIKSASKPEEYIKDSKPEVCFIGRSNVGKSSLINSLSNSKIAKTSSTPGRTQLVNFFDFGEYRIVDLPGYGFAKLSKQQQNNIMLINKNYFENSKNLKTIIHICDANALTDLDVEMSKYFRELNKNYYIILNKIDKEKMYWYTNNIDKISKFLEFEKENIILVSASKKININKLSKTIYNSIR